MSENQQPQVELPPDIQSLVDEAKKNGTAAETQVDEQGNVTVGEAPDNLVQLSDQQKKPNKADLKRMEIYNQRLKRQLDKTASAEPAMVKKFMERQPNMTEEQALKAVRDLRFMQAREVLAREDWDKLPTDKKFQRLVNHVAALQTRLQQFASDLMNLRHNDQAISDAFQINHMGLEKLLIGTLKLEPDAVKKAFKEAETEFNEERQKAIQAMREAQQKKQAAAQQQSEQAETKGIVEQMEQKPAEPGAEAPPEATVFGG